MHRPFMDQPMTTESKPVIDPAIGVPAPAVQSNAAPAARAILFDWNAPQFAERLASELGRLSVHGDTQKFEINPRNLGRLEVSFLVRDGQEQIQINTVNERVREVIMQHSAAVQEMLKSQGRGDINLRVDVRENATPQFQDNQSGLAQQQGERQRHENAAGPTANAAGRIAATELSEDDQKPADNSRYA